MGRRVAWGSGNAGRLGAVSRRAQLIPWKSAGRRAERQTIGDDVVKTTGRVFNNETG